MFSVIPTLQNISARTNGVLVVTKNSDQMYKKGVNNTLYLRIEALKRGALFAQVRKGKVKSLNAA